MMDEQGKNQTSETCDEDFMSAKNALLENYSLQKMSHGRLIIGIVVMLFAVIEIFQKLAVRVFPYNLAFFTIVSVVVTILTYSLFKFVAYGVIINQGLAVQKSDIEQLDKEERYNITKSIHLKINKVIADNLERERVTIYGIPITWFIRERRAGGAICFMVSEVVTFILMVLLKEILS